MTEPVLTPVFRIRPAVREDVSLILEFIRSLAEYEQMSDRVVATESSLERSLFEDRLAEVLIAEETGRPVGFALFYPMYSTFLGAANLFLEDLFIESAFRNRGYGKAMFAELADIARRRGCRRIDWYCLNWNAPSIAFYRRMGAKRVDEWQLFRLEGEALQRLSEKKGKKRGCKETTAR